MILSVASSVVPAVIALIAIPITADRLGDQAYGVLVLASGVVAYIGILDFGMGLGIVRYTSMFVALRNGRALRGLLRFVAVWFMGASAIGFAVAWVLSPWLAGTALNVPGHLIHSTTAVIRLSAAAFGFSMLASQLSVVPEGFLRYDLHAALTIVASSISLGSPAVAVVAGANLLTVAWVSLAASVIACASWGLVALRLLTGLRDDGPPFRRYRHEFVDFWKANAVNRVVSVVQVPTSRLIVGIAGGVAQSAYFHVPLVMSSKITELLHRMNVVLLPTGTRLVVDEGETSVVALYLRSSRLFYLLNASLVCSVVVFSYPLLRFWMGMQYASQGATALAILALAAGLNAVGMTSGNLNYALGRARVNLAFSLANSILNLGTLYSLTVALGITGTALSALLAAGVVPFAAWYSHRHVIRVSSWRVVRECYLTTSLAVVLVGSLSWQFVRPLASGLPSTLALAGAVALACVFCSAVSGSITASDWQAIRRAVRRVGRKGIRESTVFAGGDEPRV